jgi:hypothetical protein
VEPTLPAEAQGTDAAAAEAFVRFYWEMVNYAQATGDTATLGQLADESCSACTSGIEGIEKTYREGGSISGGGVSVSRAKAKQISSREGVSFIVAARTRVEPQVVRGVDGKSQEFPGGESALQFVVRALAGDWTVMRIDVKE